MNNLEIGQDGKSQGVLSVVEYSGKKLKQEKGRFTNVYVKNFSNDPDFTNMQLVELFSIFGEIQSACVMRDENGRSKGFGFVNFVDPECALRATKECSKIESADGASKLFCCEAKTKE